MLRIILYLFLKEARRFRYAGFLRKNYYPIGSFGYENGLMLLAYGNLMRSIAQALRSKKK